VTPGVWLRCTLVHRRVVIDCGPIKTKANLRKHGVRFADAVTALEDERAISARDAQEEEERWVTRSVPARGGNTKRAHEERI
jgi:uncharacterized DUF497 family protein